MRALRLVTRGSRLALWQATWVARALAALPRGPQVEVVVRPTRGDAHPDRPVAEVGGTGLFVKELEEALLREEADLAVHSLKDLETRLPVGLVLGAIPERGPVEDALVAREPVTLDTLPRGASVATGSPRRRALLRERRPDLRFPPLRGNVPTRVGRILDGVADATVLARAGLARLEMTGFVREVFDPAVFLPAPGQGAVAVECRSDDGEVREALRLLDHAPTRTAVAAERAFLRTLGSGCHLAAGAWARPGPGAGEILVDGFAGSAAREEIRRASRRGPAGEPESLGAALAAEVLALCSGDQHAELRAGNHPAERTGA